MPKSEGARSRAPALVAASLVAFVGWPCTGAANLFLPHTDYNASRPASAVAIGDLNSDGFADIISAHMSFNGDSLTVYLGRGDGTFQGGKTSWSVMTVSDVALGNFNGDAWLDAALPWSDSVGFELGDGSGLFPNSTYALTGNIGIDGRVAVGDLNSDGYLDAVETDDQNPGFVFVALGKGDGSFQPSSQFATGKEPNDLAIADLNGDAKPDLVVANTGCCPNETTVSVLLGNGDGTFGPKMDFTSCMAPRSVAVGDLNSDGVPDIVTSCYNAVSVLLGTGDGSFQPKSDLAIVQSPSSIGLADFNGDGKLDLAVADLGANLVRVALGYGDGTFAPFESYEVGVAPSDLAVGDLNGDTRLDVVTANRMDWTFLGSVSVLLNCYPCATTAISASLVDIVSGLGWVRLRWQVGSNGAAAVVFRRGESTDWMALGGVSGGETSIVSYEDRSVLPGQRYAYRLMLPDGSEQSFTSEVWVVIPSENAPPVARLDPVYPNPIGQTARLTFGIPRFGRTNLDIYDVSGKQVTRLMSFDASPGWRSVSWDGHDLHGRPVPSGTYFARLESAGQVAVRKVVVAR